MSRLEWLTRALTELGIPQCDALAELAAYRDAELGFWFLLHKESSVYNDYSLRVQFPSRKVIPFARRMDCDDIAVVVVDDAECPRGGVLRIHDGAMPGTEVRGAAASLDEWLNQARMEAKADQEFRALAAVSQMNIRSRPSSNLLRLVRRFIR